MTRTLLVFPAAVCCCLLVLPVALLVAAAVAFAAGARRIGRLIEPAHMPWSGLIAFDAVLGWRPRPNLDTHYMALGDDVYRIVTDAEGWPGRRPLDDSDIIVIGDSFAFGYGTDTARGFAEIDPRLRVKAVGAPGYSMVHGALLLEQLAVRLRGKLVVWFVYPENDLQDNLTPEMRQYRAPFARLDPAHGRWEIARAHISTAPWLSSALEYSRLFARMCVPGPLADRAYAASDYLIERAAAACAAADARLVLVTIPTPMQMTPAGRAALARASGRPDACDARYPDRRIAAACRRHGVPMVSGLDQLLPRDYKRREGVHWNASGHRRMAKVLARLHAQFVSGASPGREWQVPLDRGVTSVNG